MSDFLGGGGGLGQVLDFTDDGGDGLVDTALQVGRVEAGGDVLEAFAHDGLGQHGSGGGTVTGVVGGLGSDFLDQLGAHVFQLVLQFDFLGDGHAVLGHGRGAEATLQHDVAALGTQGDLDCVGQDVDAVDDLGACFIAENNLLCCHVGFSRNSVQFMSPGSGRSAWSAGWCLVADGRPYTKRQAGCRITSRRRRTGLLRA